MKGVLISIQPKWCELIASGEKTVEIRKTKPKLETPFKVYIYCTNNGGMLHSAYDGLHYHTSYVGKNDGSCINGKVIGEFVCCEIFPIRVFENGSIQDYMSHYMEHSCVPYDDISSYIGKDKIGYGWRISDLVIYDKPKELVEFRRDCDYEKNCGDCPYFYVENTPSCYETWCEVDGHIPLKRPPQSWCYVDTEEKG